LRRLIIAAARSALNASRSFSIGRSAARKFLHELLEHISCVVHHTGRVAYLIFSVNSIASTDTTSCSCRARGSSRTIITPVGTTLSATSQHSHLLAVATVSIPIGAVSGHVACISTDTTDDVGREVALFWAVVLSVTNLTTVLASLVLIVSEGTVERCKLTKLVALELVLPFGNRGGLRRLELDLNSGGGTLTVSMMLWINFLALLTFSSVSAIIRQ
jgi:hypothetical protein